MNANRVVFPPARVRTVPVIRTARDSVNSLVMPFIPIRAAHGILIAGAALAPAPAVGAEPAPAPLTFTVLRDGAPIGTHLVSFAREGDRLAVDIAIDFEIKFAFLTVYRYTHRSREIWRDGRLAALDARTDDNGARTELRARATEDGLAVDGSGGRFVAPADTIPTSYWHEELVQRSRILDTQAGRLIDVTVRPDGRRPRAVVAGRDVAVRAYQLTGDLVSELAYSGETGEWIELRFIARGSEIVYRRDAPPAAAAVTPSGEFRTGPRPG